jgi:hypothetical protein
MSARTTVRLLAIGVLFNFAIAAQASTIIKLDLGNVGPDIGMNSAGQLATINDGDPSTVGDQDTNVAFTGGLSAMGSIIAPPPASFTLNGLTATGPAQVFGTLVVQNFTGGQLSLFDTSNNLLLSGSLTGTSLTGVIGSPATGALFTTSLATATGGSLAPLLLPGTLSLSMNLTNINGGAGFSVSIGTLQTLSDDILQPFMTDASVNLAADVVPEPATLALLTFGSLGLLVRRKFAR